MKTLFQINITANWGSTGKVAESIGIAVMKQGWESYIAYGRWYNPSQSHLIKVGGKLDMYLHYGEQRIFDNEGLCSRGATKMLIRQIKEIKPDIVQLHNIHDHYLNYRLLFEYINQTDIKVVWTFHDCWVFTGHCFHFVTADCDRWKVGCHDCPLVHDYPNTLFDRSQKNYALKKRLFAANNNLTIVACSRWIGNFVKQSFLKDKRIEVIHNGVDINVFKPSAASTGVTSLKNFFILGVSNVWVEKKGLYDIFKLRERLDDSFVITLVGLTSNQVRQLPAGIIGIERTQNVQELVDLYSASNVLINPTYADNFPTVNIEALSCGTAVITYDTGGSPEAVDDKTGFVIKQGDIDALTETIKHMKEFPLSKEACHRRVEYFEKDKCYQKYIQLYS